MASLQEIKRRIKAVQSTSQITKAMEMVSATKMRRSQEIALRSRPYSLEVLRILGELTHRTEYLPEIMRRRKIAKRAVVLVASDRGLAGPFNANVFRAFERWRERHAQSRETLIAIAVGKKAEEYFARKGVPVAASFADFGDFVEIEEVAPLTAMLIQGYLKGSWDEVAMISTHFRTTLRQEVFVREVLPISAEKTKAAIKEIAPEYGRYAGFRQGINGGAAFNEVLDFEYLIEPDPKTVLDDLAPKLVEIVLYDFILEANASEHSARMVAMKNASENAAELKNSLSIEYNKSRQAGITREISEIVSGAEALRAS